jgi:hypothetical protein
MIPLIHTLKEEDDIKEFLKITFSYLINLALSTKDDIILQNLCLFLRSTIHTAKNLLLNFKIILDNDEILSIQVIYKFAMGLLDFNTSNSASLFVGGLLSDLIMNYSEYMKDFLSNIFTNSIVKLYSSKNSVLNIVILFYLTIVNYYIIFKII